MSNGESQDVGRRDFLKAGGVTTAAALTAGSTLSAAQDDQPVEKDGVKPFPSRKLGKTGVNVTIINQGTWRSSGTDRLIRQSYAQGVRCYDTAAVYGSEINFKRWFEEAPEVRKEIFLVSKSMCRDIKEFVSKLDERLEKCGTDHLDLYFWHALGDHGEPVDFAKSKEFADAVETIKKSGKAKYVGFSTHHASRGDQIRAAAEGGFTDVVMLQYSPFLDKESDLNRSLDLAHKAGIGLISMKQSAGQFGGAKGQATPVQEAAEKLAPFLKERNLTPFQGLLQAIWTDERIATVCTTMNNTDQVRDNLDAARRFEPLKVAELQQLREAALAAAPTFCADCDGRCAKAAGTDARLGDLVRYLTYHEHHGYRSEARRFYQELSEAERDWSAADLAAAREACPSRLNFAQLLAEAERHLA